MGVVAGWGTTEEGGSVSDTLQEVINVTSILDLYVHMYIYHCTVIYRAGHTLA